MTQIDLSTTVLPVFFTMGEFFFDLWMLWILGAITWRRNKIRGMVGLWSIQLFVRVFISFNPNSDQMTLIIPEPLNTTLFFLAGLGLIALFLLVQVRDGRMFWQKISGVNTLEGLLALSPREFEDMVVELYKIHGHHAYRTGASGDHGVDVVVEAKNGEKWVVQCKRWRTKVGEPIVRDFYGMMQHEKADKGVLITAGEFTRPAVVWAKGKPISLYDGETFLKHWRRAQLHVKKQENVIQTETT